MEKQLQWVAKYPEVMIMVMGRHCFTAEDTDRGWDRGKSSEFKVLFRSFDGHSSQEHGACASKQLPI